MFQRRSSSPSLSPTMPMTLSFVFWSLSLFCLCGDAADNGAGGGVVVLFLV